MGNFAGRGAGVGRFEPLRNLDACRIGDEVLASVPSEQDDGMSKWTTSASLFSQWACREVVLESSQTAIPAPGLPPNSALSATQVQELKSQQRHLLNSLRTSYGDDRVNRLLRGMSKDEWLVTMDTKDLRLASAIIVDVFRTRALTAEDTWVKDMLGAAAPEARAVALFVLLVGPSTEPMSKQTKANIMTFSEMMATAQPDGSGALLQALIRLKFPDMTHGTADDATNQAMAAMQKAYPQLALITPNRPVTEAHKKALLEQADRIEHAKDNDAIKDWVAAGISVAVWAALCACFAVAVGSAAAFVVPFLAGIALVVGIWLLMTKTTLGQDFAGWLLLAAT